MNDENDEERINNLFFGYFIQYDEDIKKFVIMNIIDYEKDSVSYR